MQDPDASSGPSGEKVYMLGTFWASDLALKDAATALANM